MQFKFGHNKICKITIYRPNQKSSGEADEMIDQLYLSKGIPDVSLNFISCQ